MCHVTYACALSHSYVNATHLNESCHTYEWVMSHLWMTSRYICVCSLAFICVAHSYVWHDLCMCDMTYSLLQEPSPLLFHACDMTHSYVRHDSFIRVTWLIDTFDMTRAYVWHDSFILVTWLIHACDMTHSYVWHDLFMRVTWLMHTCDMNHSYVRHDSCIRVTWLLEVPCSFFIGVLCALRTTLRGKCEWHDSFICVTWLIHTCVMTHSYVWHESFIWMIWRIAHHIERQMWATWLMHVWHDPLT